MYDQILALRRRGMHLVEDSSDSNRWNALPGSLATRGEGQQERCGEWHLQVTSIYNNFLMGVAETSSKFLR